MVPSIANVDIASLLLLVYDVHKKVENIRIPNGCLNILLLQRPPLILLRIAPRAQRELQDEHLARLGKEHGCFGTDHTNVFI